MAYRWRLLGALFCAIALNYADRTSISVVFPLLRGELNLSDIALGGIGSAFLWAYAAGSPLGGVVADRWPRGQVILISLTAWSAVTLITGLAGQYWHLIGMRALLGLAECLYLPAATAMIADHHGTATRGTAMGLHSAGLNLGLIAGAVSTGYLGDRYGWRPGFFVLGGLGLILALLCRGVLLRPAGSGAASAAAPARRPLSALPRDLRALAGIPSYWIVAGKAMLSAVGIWIFLNWLPLYFRETYQMSLAASGFSGTFSLQIAATAGVLAGGWISDRFAARDRRYRMLLHGLCYLAAAPFLLVFLGRASVTAVSACVFGFSLFRGLGQANENPLFCDVVPPPLRSTALGVSNFLNTFSGGLGVLLAGVLKRRLSLGGVFACIAALMLAGAALLVAGYRFFLGRDLARRDSIRLG